MVPLMSWIGRVIAGGAAIVLALTVMAPGVGTAPPAVSAAIQWTVAREPGTSLHVYEYAITNTSSATAIDALQVDGTVAGLDRPPEGWAVSPSIFLRARVWHAVERAAALAPGRTFHLPPIKTHGLPGASHLTIFPAIALAWDDASPEGQAYEVIGPVIGTAEPEPAAAALDLVRQLRQNLIPALARDRDRSADELDRALGAAAAALARQDPAAADAAVRDAQAVTWDPGSAWRTDLHRSLDEDVAYVFQLLGRADALDPSEWTAYSRPSPESEGDVWLYPGAVQPPEVDLHAFVRQTALGFVGTVLEVGLERVGTARSEDRTRLRLQPTDVLWATRADLATPPVDVWLRGGVVQRSPRAQWRFLPADPVFALKPGATVFVAATRFEKPGSPLHGQLWIATVDTLVRIDDGDVRPGTRSRLSSQWIAAVKKQGAALVPTGASVNGATLFVAALRWAGRQAVP